MARHMYLVELGRLLLWGKGFVLDLKALHT